MPTFGSLYSFCVKCIRLQNSPFLRQKSENRGFLSEFWRAVRENGARKESRGQEKKEMGRETKVLSFCSLPISFSPWPRDSFLAPFSHFTTARQNSLKNPAFWTSGEGRGCFVLWPRTQIFIQLFQLCFSFLCWSLFSNCAHMVGGSS